jgi:hypothetical protein
VKHAGCGRARAKGRGDSLDQSNRDCIFLEMSKLAGVDDPHVYFGLGLVWTDLNDPRRRRDSLAFWCGRNPETPIRRQSLYR